jgi:hypothetical protein
MTACSEPSDVQDALTDVTDFLAASCQVEDFWAEIDNWLAEDEKDEMYGRVREPKRKALQSRGTPKRPSSAGGLRQRA